MAPRQYTDVDVAAVNRVADFFGNWDELSRLPGFEFKADSTDSFENAPELLPHLLVIFMKTSTHESSKPNRRFIFIHRFTTPPLASTGYTVLLQHLSGVTTRQS